MYKKIIVLICLIALVVIGGVFFATSDQTYNEELHHPRIKNTFSGVTYTNSETFHPRGGKDITFWVKNNSPTEITISCTGAKDKIIAKGDSGEITTTLNGRFKKKIDFKASAQISNVTIDYTITQSRDTKQ